MSHKRFHLRADQIRPVARGHGACYASDLITVQGQRVGYMYRERPDHAGDSGWRFLSGAETQAYLDDPRNLALYDVNTIANHDPDIVPLLDAPFPIGFVRDPSGRFVEVGPPEEAC